MPPMFERQLAAPEPQRDLSSSGISAEEHSGLLRVTSDKKQERAREKDRERIQREAEELLTPLKEVSDLRFAVEDLLRRELRDEVPEDVEILLEHTLDLAKNKELLRLIPALPQLLTFKEGYADLEALDEILTNVKWELVLLLPYFIARVRKLDQQFLDALPEVSRQRWTEINAVSWGTPTMGAFARLQKDVLEKQEQVNRLRDERAALLQERERQIKVMQAEVERLQGVDLNPEQAQDYEEKKGQIMALQAFLRADEQGLDIRIRQEEDKLYFYKITQLPLLAPLQHILDGIANKETPSLLAQPRSIPSEEDEALRKKYSLRLDERQPTPGHRTV